MDMTAPRKVSSSKSSGNVVRPKGSRKAGKTKWSVLFPKEPSVIGREKIDAAIDAVIARRNQK